MPTTSTPRARWGLLITNLVMGLALVFSGVLTYTDARGSADAVERARGQDLLFAARRALVAAGSTETEALAEEFEALEAQGVTFVGIFEANGRPKATAGRPAAALGAQPFSPGEAGPQLIRVGDPPRMRLVDHLLPGAGMHGMAGDRRPCRGMGCRMRRAFWGQRLMLEYEPRLSDGLISRALGVLLVSLAAAALLLGAALIFWRLSRRSERIAAQLECDRRLAALGEMSAVLGHELRNPLTALKGHAQLLVEKLGADHPGRAGAETVVSEAKRLETLTGQVLDFARSGELERALIAPNELLAAAAQDADPIRVRVEVEADLPAWSLDPIRIRQVLANLLDNALQAAPEQAVVLAAAVAGGMLRIEVRDRGPGLSADDRQRIFEPFFTRRTRGTGLGLAVARRIVEAHGGQIRVDSEPGQGATFRISLPGPPPAAGEG